MSTVQTGVRLGDKAPNFIAPWEEVRPLRDQIIVKTHPPQWSPLLEIAWRGEATRGTVVAVGPGCYPNIHERGNKDGKPYRKVRQSRQFRKTEVNVGDTVELGGTEIGGYLWTHCNIGGEDHIICREQDVCGVVTNGHERSS